MMGGVRVGAERHALLRAGIRLEYLTVGWNLVEGVVAILAAAAASSVVLLSFGIDSFVESASGAVLLWRLLAEGRGADQAAVERAEERARILVALSLLALAAYVLIEATLSLVQRGHPEASPVGIGLTAVSLAVMWWLARAKHRLARRLSSRALRADAAQTVACWWLSLIALGGLGANAAFGWWWADPLAAIGAALLIAREGFEAWRSDAA